MENLDRKDALSDTAPIAEPAMETRKEDKDGSAAWLLPLPDAEVFPRWWTPALLALALAWAALLQTRESELAGLSVALVEAGYLGLILAYYQRRSPLDWFGWTLAGSAFAASLWFAVFRSEDMGAYLRVVLWALNIVLPAYASGAVRESWDTLRGFGVKWRIVRAFFRTLRPALELSSRSSASIGRSGAAARYGASVLVLAAILLLLVPLLVASDAAFAHIVRQIVPQWLYELDFPRVLRVIFWTLVFTVFVGAYALAPSRMAARSGTKPLFGVPALSWPLILGGIVALYALYIWVQMRYFFLAADANVYQALGLTYAEYIHKGFYELLAVSFINIAIAKVSFELSREHDGAPSPVVRLLIAAVMACAVVIACSGVSRAWHYVTAYGLSVERMLVLYASFLAIAVFAIALVKLALVRLREVPVAVALAVVSFVAFAYTNVESIVGSYNIRTQPLDKLDTAYILEDLSEDALDEKLWVIVHDPARVLRTRTDWDCRGQIDEAASTDAPKPNCDPEIDVTSNDAFYEWILHARREANESDLLAPPSWFHANYSTSRLYSDPTILSSYGEKLLEETVSEPNSFPDRL